MASVNASRAGLAREVARRLEDAKIVGFNDRGHICVWSGGYSFNVYDAVRDWQEVDSFTSGSISGLSEKDSPEGRGYAKELMKRHGYKIID